MKFYHQGKKKTNETSKSEGCLLIIGFIALIFFFTLLDDIDDLKDYFFEIIGIILMSGSILYAIFAKKGKLSNYHIELRNDYFKIEKANLPIENIILDIYQNGNSFRRYHLRDTEGKISIFSVFKDDLTNYFLKNHPNQVFEFQEESKKYDGPFVTIIGEHRNLYYDLNSGKFTIKQKGKETISSIPDVYTYDSKYKLGKSLIKKK